MENKNQHKTIDIFVGVVLLDYQERIYLIKEKDKNKIGKDRWNLPGGSVDGDENLIEATLRETKEETGYDCEINSMLGCYQGKKGDSSWIYIVFEARLPEKTGKIIDVDIKAGKWFDKNDFLHLHSNDIVHPDMQLVYSTACEGRGLPIENVKSSIMIRSKYWQIKPDN